MTKIPLKSAENDQIHIQTGQIGLKQPENDPKVPEIGLKLGKMAEIPLKSPENDQKTLKNW